MYSNHKLASLKALKILNCSCVYMWILLFRIEKGGKILYILLKTFTGNKITLISAKNNKSKMISIKKFLLN